MNTLTNYLQKCLLVLALLVPSLLLAQTTKACFKARVQTPEKKMMNLQLTSSDTIPLNHLGTIYALSIDATIEQPREGSFVRIVLEDMEGKNYLVAESDRFRNDTTSVILSEYCEETAQLNGVTPFRLKCYLTNASLQMTGIHTSNEVPTRGNATTAELRAMKEEQVQNIVERINEYNVRHGRLWRAGITDLALKNYNDQHAYEGEDSYMANFKYYVDGFYEIGERKESVTRSITTSNYVNSFDWRNRHGRNWITPVKDQGTTLFCPVFAVTGMLESLTNLYFNDTINLNLSEQSVIGYMFPQGAYLTEEVMSFIRQYGILGVTSELSFTGSTGALIQNRPESQDTISFHWHQNFPTGINSDTSADTIKGLLINYGPCVWGYDYPKYEILNGQPYQRHTMTLVGYGTITYEDVQNQLQITTVTSDSMNTNPTVYNQVGRTYWILKDSYGHRTDSIYHHNGYRYIVFNDYNKIQEGYYINTYITWNQRSDDDIICEDRDGDGYFYWGLSNNIPAALPSWAERVKDGDDSNPYIGYMDNYGHLDTIYYLYDSVDIYDMEDEDDLAGIHGGHFSRWNIRIRDGGSLEIIHEMACALNSTITIKSGGTLIVNGGKLYNPTIIAEPGSHIIIENGGQVIYDKKACDFNIPAGVTFEMTKGDIVS